MPIYEYKCDQCDHRLEKLQKISDDPAKTCPECGEEGLRKLVSAAAFKLTGTGWYETDFKDKKPKTDAKASTSDKMDSKKTAEANSKKPDSSSKSSPNKSKETAKPSASSSSSG